MRRFVRFLAPLAFIAILGAGCEARNTYVAAPEVAPIHVTPTTEGGSASTGGQSATVTPVLPTEILNQTFPVPNGDWSVDEGIEIKNPVPLPDGSRAEYTSIAREYHLKDKGAVKALLSDTRGIPALTAFLASLSERADEQGYRSKIRVGELEAWVTYAYGPNREEDGSGSLTLLFRERFLLQLDGGPGISAEALVKLAEAFHWDVLR